MEVPILPLPPTYNPIDPDKNPTMGGASLIGQTRQTLTVTDLICEGPIQGLVDGASSIFLNDDRAVPDSESQISLANGPITIGLVNGSTTATISANAPDNLIAESTGGPRSLIIKKAVGPIPVTVANLTGAQKGTPRNAKRVSVTSGQALLLESYMYARAGRYNEERYVAVRLEPAVADADSLKIPTLGWLQYETSAGSGNKNSAIFYPGSQKVNSGYEIELGAYNLIIDTISEITSISNNTLTLKTAWSGTTGSYDFDVNGGIAPAFDPANSLQGSLLTTYGGVQTQFRTGTRDQTSFTGQGGVGSTAISNNPSAGGTIEWSTGYGGSQAPKELIGGSASGFNLTSSQILELDEARISWQYGALYSMDDEGEEMHNTVLYRVQLQIKRLGESSFDPAFDVHGSLRHHAKSKNAISFNIVTDMKQYQPMTDFKFTISRRTDHEGDAHDSNGVRDGGRTTNAAAATISSTTAIIKENLSHPYSAMAKVSFSSKEFQNMPKRSYHLRGSMVRVPSNYVTREELGSNQATYNRDSNGIVQNTYQDWDGSFRPTLVYTNNPAWIFYDILINNRYGLGDFLSKSDIDIYQLYRIARYCDELVLDGKGGYEPRFTCNLYLTKQADAFKVLKDMLTTFRGLLYFIDGKIAPIHDAPAGAVYNFSKSNVIDGSFSYEGTGSKTRINQVVVSWNNPDNNYKLEPLLVEDRANIAKTNKIISQDSSAFGCASEGQALRYGRWKLWTAANQTEIVRFSTGVNGSYLFPGDIVNVQDADRNSVRYSGRISSNLEKSLTLSATHPQGELAEGATGLANANYTDPVVISCTATLPATFTQDECLFEKGGTGRGMLVGVLHNSGNPQLLYRFSEGSGANQATGTLGICEKVAISAIPEFDGGIHNITWEAYPAAPGRGRLWIDGRLIIDATTTDASAVESSAWGGTNIGGYGQTGAAIPGEYTGMQPWHGALHSDLRVYNDQSIPYTNTLVSLDSPVTLNANSTYELSIVFITPRAFLAQDSATINSVNYVRGDLIESAFIDSNGDGTYTFQLINSETDATNAKATQTGTEALLLSWSDYTSVEQRAVSTSAGTTSTLTVSTAFSEAPTGSHIWVLSETDNSGATVASSAQPYKILAVSESEKNTYEITAVAHYDEKFSAIETDFTTYIADPVLPRIIATDIVPTVRSFYSSVTASSTGQNVNLFWEPPASLGVSTVVAESDAPASGNTQTIVDGGVSNYYEFLSGFEIHHNIEGMYSPIRVGKDARSFSLPNIALGEYSFAIRAINTLDNKSQATLIDTSITTNFSANVGRFAHGAPFGGQLDVGGFIDLAGLFQFENYKYTMTPGGKANSTTNTLSTDALWKQDCSDMSVISYAQGTGSIFDASLSYILFDASDSSDRLKLLKLYEDVANEDSYWYDSGTGNGTRFGSNLTGTISKAQGSSTLVGTNTLFTSELQAGDMVFGGAGNDPLTLGRVVSIQSNTSLTLDRAHGTFTVTSASIRIPNIRIDAINDRIISSVYRTAEGFFHTPFAFIGTDVKIQSEPPHSGLAYYWPSNSINGSSMTEVITGTHAVAQGTPPTVSTDSPVGNSLVNDDGLTLISNAQADALESGGFSASYWFKSTSTSGSGNGRLLTRDNNSHWAMYMNQTEAADGVQDLKLQVVGTGATVTKTNVITLNQWHHAGIVYDGTNFKFFLDGEEIFNKTGYTPVSGANTDRPIVFGVNTEQAPQSTNKFKGQFTEIKFYDKPLTNGEIRGLYEVPGATVAGTSDTPLELGTGTSVLNANSEGLFLGNTTFASAPFRVDMAGNLNATSATVTGTITGASVIADTVTIGGGTAGDVVTGSDIIGAGSVNLNPNMTLVAPDGRPQGVLSAFGSASIGNISYQDAAKTVLKLHTSTGNDNTTGAVWPAFRVNPDATYKVLIRWKSTAASSTGAYLRIEELDTEMPIGKTHISHNSASSEAAVNEDTREINLWNNDAIGTSYVDQIFDYTPTSTAKWASALALNWAGMGTSEMHIDLLYIVEDTSVKSQGSVGGWTIDSDAIFAGTKKTTDDFSASAGDITISSTGAIRANKFLLKANGDASFKGDITGASGTFAGELTAGSLTVDKLSGDFNEEYLTQFRAVQTGDHTLASTAGTYTTIQEFSIPAPEGVAKAIKVSGTLSTKAFNGTGSTQSTEYSIHLEMKAKGTAATNIGTAVADATSAGTVAESVYVSGNKLKEFGSAGSVSASANGSSGQGNMIGLFYDAPNNRTYIEYIDASVSFDAGDTVYYSAENFTSGSGFVQIQAGFDDSTDRQSIIALPNSETFYDKTYLSASLPKTSTATEFRLRVRNRKVLPTNLSVTFPTGAFKLEHIV